MLMFEDDMEIDESLFGRKGEPKRYFGIIEHATNTLIIYIKKYPVDKRGAATLISSYSKPCISGSRIFSDSWDAYLRLNDFSYNTF